MPSSPTPAKRPGRLLIVDDSAMIRRLLAARLRQAGHDVVEASDGLEALQAFRHEAREVVVTDVCMPGMGGLDLLAELRREPSPPEVILLTGGCAGDAEAAARALRLGAHDHISKAPSALDAVVEVVGRALEKRRRGEEEEYEQLVRELLALGFTDPLIGLGTTFAPENDDDEGLAHFARADGAPHRVTSQGRNQVGTDGDGEPIALSPGGSDAPATFPASVAEGMA